MSGAQTHTFSDRASIKYWTNDLPVDHLAQQQLEQLAMMPFIYRHIAVMPDVHAGKGSTIGSVIATNGAIIPAAVGVDIGCGMMAVQTTLKKQQITQLPALRQAIEKAIPHGRKPGRRDPGSWHHIPDSVSQYWEEHLLGRYKTIIKNHADLASANAINHLGTLGTGNHFIEVSADEHETIWLIIHSGSRGIGNAIGSYFIREAQKICHKETLPHRDLAYLTEHTPSFDDYYFSVQWAQRFAQLNRQIMMENLIDTLTGHIDDSFIIGQTIDCHHNYVDKEHHFGRDVYLTRKGAVSARTDQKGIIPGSMGAKSFIVSGKGNAESFHSCSHGAGRILSRQEAFRRFTLNDMIAATHQVECRKDKAVIDEIPMAYKDIDKVMAAQADLINIEHTLCQLVCVKG